MNADEGAPEHPNSETTLHIFAFGNGAPSLFFKRTKLRSTCLNRCLRRGKRALFKTGTSGVLCPSGPVSTSVPVKADFLVYTVALLSMAKTHSRALEQREKSYDHCEPPAIGLDITKRRGYERDRPPRTQ